MAIRTESSAQSRDSSQKRLPPSESTDSLIGAMPAKRDAPEVLRDAQISEIIRMSIMDELIEDEVRVIRNEVGIESVEELLIDGIIMIVEKAAMVMGKWTSFEY